jgi:hypothetical protein
MSAERISAGEAHGADYDDDNGYAFIVTRTLNLTDSTVRPSRMFGAHCVALRLSLNVLTVSD